MADESQPSGRYGGPGARGAPGRPGLSLPFLLRAGVPAVALAALAALAAVALLGRGSGQVLLIVVVGTLAATIGVGASSLAWAMRHRRARVEIAEAEKRYRTLVEQIPAVVYVDEDDDLSTARYVSPFYTEMLGYAPEERMADPELWTKLLHPDDRDRVVTESIRTNRTGEPFRCEYRMIARDGRVVWVRDEAVLLLDEGGQGRAWQGILMDITDRKRAEEALREAYDREREAGERLRSLDEMKNAFLSAVSHELRTPLASVLGYAQTLQQQEMGLSHDERQLMFDRLVRNARKLARLLSDLLDLDRLARGIVEPRRQNVALAELVRRVAEDIDLGGRPLELDGEHVVAEVDPSQVERIVENLLVNAAKHTPVGAPVRLVVEDQDQGVLLAVEDAGPGIPDDLKATVFRPFERGSAVNGHAPGTGIGLSLVARFAELHGGRAWVEDRPGGGASFRVFLPRVTTPVPDPVRGP